MLRVQQCIAAPGLPALGPRVLTSRYISVRNARSPLRHQVLSIGKSSGNRCDARLARQQSHELPRRKSSSCQHASATKSTIPPMTDLSFWTLRSAWRRASLHTLRCLVGCTVGDFSAMWTLQTMYPELGVGTIMAISSELGCSMSSTSRGPWLTKFSHSGCRYCVLHDSRDCAPPLRS